MKKKFKSPEEEKIAPFPAKAKAKLEAGIDKTLNPTAEFCEPEIYSGCFFMEVCDLKNATCSLMLEIQGKPLPPACQKYAEEFDAKMLEMNDWE